MIDIVGNEIKERDVIIYANDNGFLTFAIVESVNDERLEILEKGYRDVVHKKVLVRPNNTLLITGQIDLPTPGNIDSQINFLRSLKK